MLSFSHGLAAVVSLASYSSCPFSVNFCSSIGLVKSAGPLLAPFMSGNRVRSPVGSLSICLFQVGDLPDSHS